MKKNATDSASALNILFIGNSFTARNNVPELIAQMAAAQGRKLAHSLISAGGASLRMHWNKGEAQRVLAATPFDFVVLQEQSTLPVKNATACTKIFGFSMMQSDLPDRRHCSI